MPSSQTPTMLIATWILQYMVVCIWMPLLQLASQASVW